MKTVLITGEQFYFSLSRLIFVSHEILIEIISLENFNDTLVPYGGKYWTVSLLEIDKKKLNLKCGDVMKCVSVCCVCLNIHRRRYYFESSWNENRNRPYEMCATCFVEALNANWIELNVVSMVSALALPSKTPAPSKHTQTSPLFCIQMACYTHILALMHTHTHTNTLTLQPCS